MTYTVVPHGPRGNVHIAVRYKIVEANSVILGVPWMKKVICSGAPGQKCLKTPRDSGTLRGIQWYVVKIQSHFSS